MITLDSNPSSAPGCIKIVNDDGRDVLIQTDLDYPGVASTFGWSVADVTPPPPDGYSLWQEGKGDWTKGEHRKFKMWEKRWLPDIHDGGRHCEHDGTDGTIDCPCGVAASDFIAAARQYLDDNDGAKAEDPGYFG